MQNDVYYDYNPWWEGEFKFEDAVERPIILDKMEKFFESRSIVFLTGLRRVGKTTLMKIFIKQLIEKGIDPGHIFYVTLDDYVLDNKSIIDIGIRNLFTGFIKKGRAFENYVYLKIKDFEPVYVLENQVEIDFYLNNKVLVEVKFDEINIRFEALQRELDSRFEAMDKRFSVIQWMIGILVGIPALIIAVTQVLEILR